MRISRIRIDSFGAIKNRDYAVSKGLTVFHGPNESGKTSTTEFIRSVLSPTSAKKLYPARKKTDSGFLDIVDGDRTVRLSYDAKKVTGEVPECVKPIDPVLFRDVFAMDLETLNHSDALTKGEIKKRFLTVPGGDRLPDTIDWVDESVRDVVGLRSNSDSKLLRIDASIADAEKRVSEMKQRASQYRELSDRVSDLKQEKAALLKSGEEDQRVRALYENYQRNKGNYEQLEALKRERIALGEFRPVTEADIAERSRLVAEEAAARNDVETKESEYTRAKEVLGGNGIGKVSSLSLRIEGVVSGLDQYHADGDRIEESRSRHADAVPAVKQTGKGKPIVSVLGVFMALVGLILGILVSPVCYAMTVAGAAIAIAGRMTKRNAGSAAPVPAPASIDIQTYLDRRQGYEREVQSLCKELGIWFNGIDKAVGDLDAMRRSASDARRREMPLMNARNLHGEARNALLAFYQPFSGSEGFESARAKTLRAKSIDGRIAAFESAICNSGLDPNEPACPVTWDGGDGNERISEIDKSIGQMEERMRSILNMTDLEREMDHLEGLRAERSSILHRGAVMLLAKGLIESSCSDVYDSVQPGVVRSADRYLGMMTCGRYSLSIDPSSDDIEVVSGDERKSIAAWSSGLRAQALLSIKLAVAKEMGGGEIPVILDDVLLPFDSDRKRGAIGALSEISDEMQILMFTCDEETRRLAEDMGLQTVSMV